MARKKPQTLPGHQVVVYQYLAYRGGLACERTLLWHYLLVGTGGKEQYPASDGWEGHPDKKYAKRYAERWAQFLGWPLVDLGRTEDRDNKIKPGHTA